MVEKSNSQTPKKYSEFLANQLHQHYHNLYKQHISKQNLALLTQQITTKLLQQKHFTTTIPLKPQGTMSKYWCITANGRTQTWEEIQAKAEDSTATYMCMGAEGDQPGKTPHWQGYLQLEKRTRMTSLKKIFYNGWHWSKMGGTPKQARDYCFKECGEEKLNEYGEFSGKGKGYRTDIHTVVQAITDGATHKDLVIDHPVALVKWRAGLLSYAADLKGISLPDQRPVNVLVFWGVTDSGKTHTAMDHDDVYMFHCVDLKENWWDGYNGEKRLVLDEFSPDSCKITQMLKLLDVYKQRLNVKHSFKYAEWDTVILTTNIEWPGMIYTGANQQHRAALFRRITRVVHFEKQWREATPIIIDDPEDQEDIPEIYQQGLLMDS